MSPVSGVDYSRSDQTDPVGSRSGLVTLFVALVVLALAGGVLFGSGVGPVAAEDNETGNNETPTNDTTAGDPPVLHSGEKVNATTMAVTLVSDVGIDTETVDASEFFLTDGTLDRVTVTAAGTNATAYLHLEDRLDTDEVGIGVTSGTAIADLEGTQLDTEVRNTVTVTGMDTVPPELRNVHVPSLNKPEAEIAYTFDEAVSDIQAVVHGPEEKHLTGEDFERLSGYRYGATVELDDGAYSVELLNATDEAGNTAEFGVESTMNVTSTPPDAVIEIDREASSASTLVFDGSNSSERVEEFRWEFGDGHTATGERVSHNYHPGVYRVTLEVEDEAGMVGEDERVVSFTNSVADLQTGDELWPAEPRVDLQLPGPMMPFDAIATVRGLGPGEEVHVESGDERPLVAHESFTLDSVALTTSEATTVGLLVQSVPAGDFEVLESETGTVALGGFEASTNVASEILSDVTFEFDLANDVLEEHDADSEDVAMYRYHDGDWESLTTRQAVFGDGWFSADSPGFSTFAVTVDVDDPEADEPDDEETDDEETDGEETDEGDDETDEDDQEADDEKGEDEQNETNGETDDEAETDEENGDGDEQEADDENGEDEENGEADQEDVDENDEDDPNNETADNETVPDEPPELDDDDEEDENGGLLPGFVTTLAFFVLVPILIVYTGLKSVAFYLGY